MATSDQTDLESLVARSRDGDRAALNAVIQAIQPTVHTLAQRFLMIPADAEDATQEILLKIITRLGQFDGKSRFTTWAYAVASHHLLDLKRRPAEPTVTFDDFAEDLAQGLSDAPPKSPDSSLLLAEVRIGCTLALLQCLEPEARLAYVLGEIIELDHREAAQVLGIERGTYRKRLSRARDAITGFMLQHCGLAEPRNRCRCHKRLARATALGRVDPQQPQFASSLRQAQRFPAVLAEIRRLDVAQRAAALYRAQKSPGVSPAFARWLKAKFERPSPPGS